MISQSEIHSRINQIWQLFLSTGITDSVTIIENLAHFLLREFYDLGDRYKPNSYHRMQFEKLDTSLQKFEPLDLRSELWEKFPGLRSLPDFRQLIPQVYSNLGAAKYLEIGDKVRELINEGVTAADLFNNHLPQYLERMERGGRYFTPRHLTRWAASLLEIFPGARLADLACGSDARTTSTFSGRGKIFSFTTISDAPAGYEHSAPYTVALVKLDEGPVVTAQLTDLDGQDVQIGMPVEMVTRKIKDDGSERGIIVYGYKFRPAVTRATAAD